MPERLSVKIERREIASAKQNIDRFSVRDGGRRCHVAPALGDVALGDLLLPQERAVLAAVTEQNQVSRVRARNENTIPPHRGRGPAGSGKRRLPLDRFLRPGFREAGLRGRTVERRAAPLRPVFRASSEREGESGGDGREELHGKWDTD